jgi:hypothetical protein
MARTLWTASAPVAAPVEKVATLLLRVRPGEDGVWLLAPSPARVVADGPGRFRVVAPGHTMSVEVGERSIAVQGGWWYRGEYEIADDGAGGTVLTHRVRDVARTMRWGVPLVLAQYRLSGGPGLVRTRNTVATLARRLEREVGGVVSGDGR